MSDQAYMNRLSHREAEGSAALWHLGDTAAMKETTVRNWVTLATVSNCFFAQLCVPKSGHIEEVKRVSSHVWCDLCQVHARGSHTTPFFTRRNPRLVCVVSKLRWVTKTHARSDAGNQNFSRHVLQAVRHICWYLYRLWFYLTPCPALWLAVVVTD